MMNYCYKYISSLLSALQIDNPGYTIYSLYLLTTNILNYLFISAKSTPDELARLPVKLYVTGC